MLGRFGGDIPPPGWAGMLGEGEGGFWLRGERSKPPPPASNPTEVWGGGG